MAVPSTMAPAARVVAPERETAPFEPVTSAGAMPNFVATSAMFLAETQ